MNIEKGDTVRSKVCPAMFGVVVKIIDEINFMINSSGTRVLCHKDHWEKVKENEL